MRFGLSLILLAGALAACGARKAEPASSAATAETLSPSGWASNAARIVDAGGADIGEVQFRQATGGVLMRIDIRSLSSGWHGIHFHQTADCSDGADGFKKSGPHFDPGAREHGLLHEAGPEAGDLPNIYAGSGGETRAELFRAGVALAGEAALLDQDGFAVVIHASADDHQTQPIGGAGERVACAAVR